MKKKFKPTPLTDRERILTNIIAMMQFTQSLGRGQLAYTPEFFKDYAHFAMYRNPKPGELVLARSGPVDQFKIGWYVCDKGYDNHVIREIGTGVLCDYGNESFIPIVGIDRTRLLEGDQRQFYYKVQSAFKRGGSYWHLLGAVDFEEDLARIWIRERHGFDSVPYSFEMKWNRKTTIKTILEAMRAAGYNERKFELKPPAERVRAQPGVIAANIS